MLKIENQYISATFNEKGAELTSLILKEIAADYLWNGDPEFWSKQSPLLFPIVGGLKNNTYRFRKAAYQMNRHGFARDSIFTVVAHQEHQIVFELKNSRATLVQYPFKFSLQVTYTVVDQTLEVAYNVTNLTEGSMFFSIGAHPAFAVPLPGTNRFEDCKIQFSENENASRLPLDANGQIIVSPEKVLEDSNTIYLTKELFYDDALIFMGLISKYVEILSDSSKHGLKVDISEFPFLGIWSAKDANFVCIEPWQGLADLEDTAGFLGEKVGIIKLLRNESWSKKWSVTIF